MKYILMMNTMRANSPGFPGWSKKDIQAHIAFMVNFDKELRASGSEVSEAGNVLRWRQGCCLVHVNRGHACPPSVLELSDS